MEILEHKSTDGKLDRRGSRGNGGPDPGDKNLGGRARVTEQSILTIKNRMELTLIPFHIEPGQSADEHVVEDTTSKVNLVTKVREGADLIYQTKGLKGGNREGPKLKFLKRVGVA